MTELADKPLPWQQEIWQRLQQTRSQQRIPHALLFSGPEGVGKAAFAEAFAQSLLCSAPGGEGQACGHCRHCHLFKTGVHPDFHRLQPEADSKSGEIKIDMVRELSSGASLTTQSGGYKVIIIRPAERMNRAAANSLLKTLEEPTPNTVLILLSDYPSRLLPTIRSRCQQFAFALPPKEAALAWLQARVKSAPAEELLHLAGGAPLKALALDDAEILTRRKKLLQQFLSLGGNRLDPVKLSHEWSTNDMKRILEWVAGWVIDMLRLQASRQPPQLFNWDERDALHALSERLNSSLLQRFLGQVYETQGLLDGNLNPQLMLEKLLIEWNACMRRALR